jgi:hypothetical protein
MDKSILPALALCLVAALAGCKPAPVPGELPGETSEPAVAVRLLAQRLHDNDWVGFAQAAVPPDDYARLAAAWRNGNSRWPLTLLPLNERLLPLLQTLSASAAEAELKQGYDQHLARQDSDLRDAARNLGLFGVKYAQEQGGYSEQQRQHYKQVIAALSAWGQRAPLGNPVHAHTAIDRLCAAARRTGITDDASLRELGMETSLTRLAPFFAEIKAVLADGYQLPLDESLAGLRSGLIAKQEGDNAQVQVRYPLADEEINAVLQMQRRVGRWYLAGVLRDAEQALAADTAVSETTPPDLPP